MSLERIVKLLGLLSKGEDDENLDELKALLDSTTLDVTKLSATVGDYCQRLNSHIQWQSDYVFALFLTNKSLQSLIIKHWPSLIQLNPDRFDLYCVTRMCNTIFSTVPAAFICTQILTNMCLKSKYYCRLLSGVLVNESPNLVVKFKLLQTERTDFSNLLSILNLFEIVDSNTMGLICPLYFGMPVRCTHIEYLCMLGKFKSLIQLRSIKSSVTTILNNDIQNLEVSFLHFIDNQVLIIWVTSDDNLVPRYVQTSNIIPEILVEGTLRFNIKNTPAAQNNFLVDTYFDVMLLDCKKQDILFSQLQNMIHNKLMVSVVTCPIIFDIPEVIEKIQEPEDVNLASEDYILQKGCLSKNQTRDAPFKMMENVEESHQSMNPPPQESSAHIHNYLLKTSAKYGRKSQKISKSQGNLELPTSDTAIPPMLPLQIEPKLLAKGVSHESDNYFDISVGSGFFLLSEAPSSPCPSNSNSRKRVGSLTFSSNELLDRNQSDSVNISSLPIRVNSFHEGNYLNGDDINSDYFAANSTKIQKTSKTFRRNTGNHFTEPYVANNDWSTTIYDSMHGLSTRLIQRIKGLEKEIIHQKEWLRSQLEQDLEDLEAKHRTNIRKLQDYFKCESDKMFH